MLTVATREVLDLKLERQKLEASKMTTEIAFLSFFSNYDLEILRTPTQQFSR